MFNAKDKRFKLMIRNKNQYIRETGKDYRTAIRLQKYSYNLLFLSLRISFL